MSRAASVADSPQRSTDVDKNAGVFSYGITIGAESQRQGYASETIILVLHYRFGERRFQSCDVAMYAFNTASVELILHRRCAW